MNLVGTFQQQPAPGARSEAGLAFTTLTVTAETYDQAYEQLIQQCPDEFRLISVRRD